MSTQIDIRKPARDESVSASDTGGAASLDPLAEESVSGFLHELVAAGWTLSAPRSRAPRVVSLCLVARPPADRRGVAEPHLLYVYRGETTLSIDDLWRVATDARASACSRAVMLLSPDVRLTAATRDAAARLNVRILRLAG